ncbi:hypothetical protein CCUS01_00957 [Colletotrichum cuscutae]|uniref:Uncharacterized protein n=1 Tax=Colletotrichum cuscutae TaxID=1209917 RepID=A0AAI9V4W2_9PEZI|nr:hypothetical protein CCUS01_00957 [Colletotrichum cuscutae]
MPPLPLHTHADGQTHTLSLSQSLTHTHPRSSLWSLPHVTALSTSSTNPVTCVYFVVVKLTRKAPLHSSLSSPVVSRLAMNGKWPMKVPISPVPLLNHPLLISTLYFTNHVTLVACTKAVKFAQSVLLGIWRPCFALVPLWPGRAWPCHLMFEDGFRRGTAMESYWVG